MGKKAQQGNDAQAELDEMQAAPEAPEAPENDGLSEASMEQLQQLAKLKDQGVLTQEEFDAQKQKILGM